MFVEAGMDWADALEMVGLPQAKQDAMKLKMAQEAHEMLMNPPEPPPSQAGGDPKPNQPAKKPSPAREANDK